MFRLLKQNEMLCVNGGFYYIPVYDIYKYYRRVGNKRVYLGMSKKFITTVQVSSTSDEKERIRNVFVVYR